MKIPFANLFQRSKSRLKPAAAPPRIDAPMPTAKKAESERLGKTVMPNTARQFVAETEPSPSITSHETTVEQAGFREPTPPQTSSIATEVAVPAPPPPRISMGATPQTPPSYLPPAVAVALAPNIERAISLPLEDVISQMPEGYLKPRASFDVNRPVLLRAAEVEKGMAAGRPTIPIATLFQQAPDIFMHTVPSSDGALIALPFERVMNALSNLARRRDQTAVQAVPQVETPFLKVTKEDTERFGTPMPSMPTESEPEEAEESAQVRIEAASAEAYAAATPEATDTFVPTVDLENANRIPFTPEPEVSGMEGKFGTGEPAFPRVPASSGPPVPSAPAFPATPAPIAFTFPAPSNEAGNKAEKLKAETLKSEDAGQWSEIGGQKSQGAEPVLTLPLRPILEHLPPMQLGGNPATVSAEATVSFPMSMIAPQLAAGKVTVKTKAFYAALPEEFRKLFLPDAVDAPVQLPLADILAHLPGEALRMREDQEEHTQDEIFETPFSAKAKEDAARFGEGERVAVATKPQTPVLAKPVIVPTEGRKSEAVGHVPEVGPKFDAKEAVAKACALRGVQSCSVIFSDGLSIAGNIPESMRVDGLSAVAPTLLQKLGKHMLETSLGTLKGMTVHAENAEVSFFAAGDICLTAFHGGDELGADSRHELIRTTEEISRAYCKS